jgi:uncharacterized tellurite resistance protein B-like protein
MLKKILDALGVASPSGQAGTSTSPAVQAIADRLDGLDPERARLVAALAMVLARAARADMEASERERALIATILQQHAGLSADQADLVTELVTHRNQLFGSSEAYLATREFRRLATAVELECILRCLFAVCAADDSIALVEEEEVRQVASELGFTHEQFVAARSAFREQREVLRGLGRVGGPGGSGRRR